MSGNRIRRAIVIAPWLVGLTGWATAVRTAAAQRTEPAAPPLLLANLDGPHIDPGRYLVSEKYDGVRAVWNGRTLLFRSGRPVPAPAWFIQRLPAQPLDGELWLGRGRFDALSGVVRSDPPDDTAWRQVHYMAFELPGAPGSFAERAERLAELASSHGWPPLEAVAQRQVDNREALLRLLQATVDAGGEGLMLHLAKAPYTTGRSDVLIKLKPQLDTEAVVVAHRPGKGKYTGMLGALVVETPEGRRFAIGTGLSDAQRHEPPAIGSTITYRYRDLTSTGLPRFASFMRVRESF